MNWLKNLSYSQIITFKIRSCAKYVISTDKLNMLQYKFKK